MAGSLLLAFVCRASEPAYPHGAFVEECSLCHRSDRWVPARVSERFDHGKFGFPLSGAHARADCRACHSSLEFARADPACVSCHEDIHQGELGTDCARCHSSRSFIDRAAMVRSHLLTRFPLTGAHLAQDCEDCHRPAEQGRMRFVHVPVDCVACHRAAFEAATDPNHVTSGFPEDCRQCHSVVSWARARFDHSATRFPLTGAHVQVPCASCHGGGVYGGLAADCASCHRADYDTAADPAHAAAGFSLDCASCHDTVAWQNATFLAHDGSFFPIYSGKHRDKWEVCSDCHANRSSYSEFTCLVCHAHSDPVKMAGKHLNVGGYVYESQACYACHPQGSR
jgi:hypothetical protein